MYPNTVVLCYIKASIGYPNREVYIKAPVGYPRSSSRERSGSVVECLTRDRRAVGSSLTGVTALWSLSKTHLS